MTACTSFLAFFAEQMLAFAVKMHSRPGRWPLEAAKRLEARAHAVRSAGTLGRLRRHSAKTSDRVILVDKPKVCQRSESLADRVRRSTRLSYLFGRVSWNVRKIAQTV